MNHLMNTGQAPDHRLAPETGQILGQLTVKFTEAPNEPLCSVGVRRRMDVIIQANKQPD
jgi:hypothetical protein